jgi:hypothetical protein
LKKIFLFGFLFLILVSQGSAFFDIPKSNTFLVANNLYNGSFNLSYINTTTLIVNGTAFDPLNYVPYTGGTANLELGGFTITAQDFIGSSIDVSGESEASTFYAMSKIASRPNMFAGLGYSNENFVIKNSSSNIFLNVLCFSPPLKKRILLSFHEIWAELPCIFSRA